MAHDPSSRMSTFWLLRSRWAIGGLYWPVREAKVEGAWVLFLSLWTHFFPSKLRENQKHSGVVLIPWLPPSSSPTILPALLMEECQALRQRQCHPHGTSPVTGVLGQVVAQRTLGNSREKRRTHKLEVADLPWAAEISLQTSPYLSQQMDMLIHPG